MAWMMVGRFIPAPASRACHGNRARCLDGLDDRTAGPLLIECDLATAERAVYLAWPSDRTFAGKTSATSTTTPNKKGREGKPGKNLIGLSELTLRPLKR